jgi:hypothetical protein
MRIIGFTKALAALAILRADNFIAIMALAPRRNIRKNFIHIKAKR